MGFAAGAEAEAAAGRVCGNAIFAAPSLNTLEARACLAVSGCACGLAGRFCAPPRLLLGAGISGGLNLAAGESVTRISDLNDTVIPASRNSKADWQQFHLMASSD
ncbi:hypothetical protein K3725_21655 (plasmid) [Leisingera sp. S132]|uniref:hypothetical protein n=1 Tax=Leisingera sp. S132 TaxID=2867016 RepID=UPI0021A3EEBC|nr:hypothetical protein [Leisingera sp. S132]UWQ81793.1 hypothetical protein K3725_21655 [Leisingera sp. S132]